ncbi:hypothetical protein ACM66B_004019 [Microbotryomycetes sp. NB124-2]
MNAPQQGRTRVKRRVMSPELRRRQGPTTTGSQELVGETTTSVAADVPSTTESTTTAAAPTTTTTTVAAPVTTAEQTTTTSSTSVAVEPTTTNAQTTTLAQTTTPRAQPTTTESSVNAPSTTVDDVVPTTTTSAQITSTVTTSRSQSTTVIMKTYTSVLTDPEGKLSTQTSVSSTVSAVPTAAFNNSSHTGRTWGIVGGVAGGVVLLVAIVFVVYRLTQRRFSNLDEAEGDIKWPELLPGGQEVSNSTSTINPLGTRRTNGAGIGDDGDSEFGDDLKGAGFGGGAATALGPGSFRPSASQEYLVSQGPGAMVDPYHRRNESADSSLQQHAYPPAPAFAMYSGSPAPSYHSSFRHDATQEELVHARSAGGRYSPLRGASPPRDQFNDHNDLVQHAPDRPLSMNSTSSAYDSARSHYRADSRTSANGAVGEVISFGLTPVQLHSPHHHHHHYHHNNRSNSSDSPSQRVHGSRSPSPF